LKHFLPGTIRSVLKVASTDLLDTIQHRLEFVVNIKFFH